jgi:demethylmenaquinone methyltransferase/2-methoxy-6-polyprenyl-1,4-benzoquinol methylase
MRKEKYKWFYDRIHSRYYNLLMKYCFLPFGGERKCRLRLIEDIAYLPGERILDMCCGTGGCTLAVAGQATGRPQVIGMDLSSGQLGAAIRSGASDNIKFVEGDVRRTGFPAEHFDKVFIAHALHEMDRQERLAVLREARRVLKPSGQLIIIELDRPDSPLVRFFAGLWYGYWLPFNFETPTRRDMLKQGVLKEAAESGFTNLKCRRHYRGIFQVVTGYKQE